MIKNDKMTKCINEWIRDEFEKFQKSLFTVPHSWKKLSSLSPGLSTGFASHCLVIFLSSNLKILLVSNDAMRLIPAFQKPMNENVCVCVCARVQLEAPRVHASAKPTSATTDATVHRRHLPLWGTEAVSFERVVRGVRIDGIGESFRLSGNSI